MSTLKKIIAKWNGKNKLYAGSVLRLYPEAVYIAISVNDNGFLLYQFAETSHKAIDLLSRQCENDLICVYHVDALYRLCPQLFGISTINTESLHRLKHTSIYSHMQVREYGVYRARHIDINDEGIFYTLYENTAFEPVVYNGEILPSEVIIRSTKEAIPEDVWNKVGLLIM